MRYRRREVLWRQAGGVLVLAQPDGDEPPLAMVGPAAAIWMTLVETDDSATRLSDEPCTADEIVELLADVFATDVATVHSTVTDVLAGLERDGFVERVS